MNILLYNKATKKLCTIAPAVERGRVLEGPGRDTGLGATRIMPIQILLRWGSHTTGPNQHWTKEGIFSVIRTIRLRSPYAGKEGVSHSGNTKVKVFTVIYAGDCRPEFLFQKPWQGIGRALARIWTAM
jgi:hypothetical protein